MESQPYTLFKINAMGTVAVIEAARLAGVERVVFTSSRAYYGETPRHVGEPGYVPLAEDYPPHLRGAYNTAKIASEGMGRHFARVYGLQFAVLRFPAIYGPGKRKDAYTPYIRLVEDSSEGKPVRIPVGGDQVDDLVSHVDDVAESIVTATLAPTLGYDAYNIGTGIGHTLKDYAAAVRVNLTHADIEIGLGHSLYGPDHTSVIFDVSRAKADLGWSPRFSLVEGIRDWVETLRRRAGGA